MNIHEHFSIDGRNLTSSGELLAIVERDYPEHSGFLHRYFDSQPYLELRTSGSTGKPKTIRVFKEDMLKSALLTIAHFDLPPGSRVLHCLSPEFVAGQLMWVRAFAGGWNLRIAGASGTPLPDTGDTFDFAAMVPLQAENSLNALQRVKKLIIGGAPVSHTLEKKLSLLPIQAFHTYGMTETLTHVALRRIDGSGRVYSALPGMRFETDGQNRLVIHTPYRRSPVYTTDIVELIDGKHFVWIGRSDYIINTGGVKIAPESIEEKLAPYLHVPFFIHGLPDERLGSAVTLIVEGNPGHIDTGELYRKAGLSKYETPKRIIGMEAFHYTGSGKIDRNKTVGSLSQTN